MIACLDDAISSSNIAQAESCPVPYFLLPRISGDTIVGPDLDCALHRNDEDHIPFPLLVEDACDRSKAKEAGQSSSAEVAV